MSDFTRSRFLYFGRVYFMIGKEHNEPDFLKNDIFFLKLHENTYSCYV